MVVQNSKIKDIGKKAQLGATLTWFVAFIVIFFIMFLFTGATALLASQKNIPIISWFIGAGESKISVDAASSIEMRMQRDLVLFLNMPAESDNKAQIKDLIIESKNTELEKEFNNFIDKLEPKPECYIFRVERDGKNDFEVYDVWGIPVLGGQRRGKPQVESILKKTIELNLILEGNKLIRARFYAGEC